MQPKDSPKNSQAFGRFEISKIIHESKKSNRKLECKKMVNNKY